MHKIKESANTKKPKQAYVELNNLGIDVRNPHQINNAKTSSSNLLSNRSNVADDLQKIVRQIACGELPIVKHFSVVPNSPTNFIVYNDMQIEII